MRAMTAAERSYCAEQVRRFDHDRYLACLFAPAERREALFALYAFNLEVAKTAEVVSEAMLGQMRLQWWREALEGIYGGRPPRHEVAAPLAEAVQRHDLGRDHFERLIEAREFDLSEDMPDDLAALEDYAEGTSASVTRLALEVLDAREGEVAAAGRHVGIAWALTGLLRAVPFHARQRRLYLPRELVQAAGLAVAGLFELRASPALCRVSEQVARRAGEHLDAARAPGTRVPKQAMPALLPAALARARLATLARAGYDPFDAAVQTQGPGRIWRLWWANLRRRY